jgi:hypothetical protein
LTIYQQQGEHGVDCAEVLFNTGLVFAAVQNFERAGYVCRIHRIYGIVASRRITILTKRKLDEVSAFVN